jgi:hypothetical protein
MFKFIKQYICNHLDLKICVSGIQLLYCDGINCHDVVGGTVNVIVSCPDCGLTWTRESWAPIVDANGARTAHGHKVAK